MECDSPEKFPSDEASQPSKRRRFYRKRVDSSPNHEAGPVEAPSSSSKPQLPTTKNYRSPLSSSSDEEEDDVFQDAQIPITEMLRRRRAAQKRRTGIEFSNAAPAVNGGADGSRPDDEILDNEDSFNKILTVVDRFAPQTGQVADVDKHIQDEYANDGLPPDLAKHRQPAALGKLHEIDLGLEATLKNIARTEAAKKRLEGGELEVEETGGKVRLRRDGKPWRRRRRNSDDVKRDKIVEEIMKESRLEIYDEPESEMQNDDQAADDRVAEQFRRDFMDAISSRRKRAARSAKKNAGAKVDEKPRGPKLGGSRSARAAMREKQEKAAKK
ncbi:MAG: hypothetical protein Q9219_005920 [cf. Caloplaca sp. 3 TL-2023]